MNKIDTLKVGFTVDDTFMVTEATIRKTNTRPPKDFLAVTLAVGNSTIDGKYWNWPANDAAPEAGKVFQVLATVGEYNGKKQLTIKDIQLAADQDLTNFVPSVGIPADTLWDSLCAVIDAIENPRLKHIVLYCYGLYKHEILASSAAKGIHHVGIGGLALHSIEVAKTAIAIQAVNVDYDIDQSLVIAGALLHDIGKIRTYAQEGALISMTHEGMLLDHISIGLNMLTRAVDFLGHQYIDEITLLQHIIASHHGELEYGSPVTPKFMEAYIINWADQVSSTLSTINDANIKAGDAALTEKIYICSNREHITQKQIQKLLNKE